MPAPPSQNAGSRLRFWLLRLFIAIVLAGSIYTGVVWNESRTALAAEKSALDYIHMNGFTNYSNRHPLMSYLLSWLPARSNQTPFASRTVHSVSFPRDRMNDYMANELLHIRSLEEIHLYPPDTQGSGLDFQANIGSIAGPLRGLDLALKEQSIVAIEKQFPKLVVRVYNRPDDKSPVDTAK